MSKFRGIPAVLTVAGSDSGGGAGVQADLKTFAALGVHGTSAITCVTAQNRTGVRAIEPVSAATIGKQIDAVMEGFSPSAVKTGMLYSAEIINAVVHAFKRHGRIPLVVDPVMVSTSGCMLLRHDALNCLVHELFPIATLVTPNLDEASALCGRQLKSVEGMRVAARWLQDITGAAVLLKGGHLEGNREAVDILRIGSNEWLLASRRIPGVKTHGTGCTLSAAITAKLAVGMSLKNAVVQAKEFVANAIFSGNNVAGGHVLNSFWAPSGQRRKGN